MQNVGEWTTQWAYLGPNDIYIKYQDLELTKKEFNLRVNRLANAFQEMGIRKGDRVSVLMANSNVFLEILFALSKIGGIMVPLNFRLAAPELEFIINDTEPKAMIYSPEFLPVIDELRDKIPSVDSYICEMEGGKEVDMEFESWTAKISDQEPAPDEKVTMDDPQFIMYTSGTTGKPKGAVLTHGNTQWNAINTIHKYPIDESDIALCCAPLFHIGALNASSTCNLYNGATLVIQRMFDPSGVLKLIEDNRITTMFGIPVMFLFMGQMPEFESTDFSSLKFFVTGGAPVPKPLIETYLKKGAAFSQGYGMTETSGPITILHPDEALKKIGSCGKPVFHTKYKIVDLAGKEVSKGESGEIMVSGPNVIKEYWRRPEETKTAIVDGWLFTGDIGYVDENDYLYIKDRRKDMYISGGENVYPAEVEDVMMGFEGIADVGVFGIDDEKWGEVGAAVVVLEPGVEINGEDIINQCKEKLAKYKVPKKIIFTDELPRTTTGKILKRELKAKFK